MEHHINLSLVFILFFNSSICSKLLFLSVRPQHSTNVFILAEIIPETLCSFLSIKKRFYLLVFVCVCVCVCVCLCSVISIGALVNSFINELRCLYLSHQAINLIWLIEDSIFDNSLFDMCFIYTHNLQVQNFLTNQFFQIY